MIINHYRMGSMDAHRQHEKILNSKFAHVISSWNLQMKFAHVICSRGLLT